MVEILPGLLLGGMGDVLSLLGSKRPAHRITRLLSILSSPIDWSEISTPQGSLMAKYVSLPDMPSSDLLSHLPSCVEYLDDCIAEGGVVLVHCEHGVSRSATVVVAYLMNVRKEGFQKSLAFLQSKKPDVRPNLGFQEQLKLWEMMDGKLDVSCKPYRAYLLHQQAQAMKRNGYMETMDLLPNPSTTTGLSTATYKCKKCRHVLLTNESILQHEVGRGDSAFPKHRHGNMSYFVLSQTNSVLKDATKNDRESETPPSLTLDNVPIETVAIDNGGSEIKEMLSCDSATISVMTELATLRHKVSALKMEDAPLKDTCSSLFIDPVEWMGPFILGNKDGKLLCPKCSFRIGSFDWSGTQCSCGKWITPSFKIIKSKVDFVVKPIN